MKKNNNTVATWLLAAMVVFAAVLLAIRTELYAAMAFIAVQLNLLLYIYKSEKENESTGLAEKLDALEDKLDQTRLRIEVGRRQ